MADNAFTPGQGIPVRLSVGDFWTWRADGFLAAYPPSEYGLSYIITPRGGGTPIVAPAQADADGWLVQVPATTTASAEDGAWTWAAIATRTLDGARVSLITGSVIVDPDPTAGRDTRTTARKMLDAIEGVLSGRIVKDVDAYTIEGRSLTRVPFEVLRQTRDRLRREVAAEDRARSGRGPFRIHHMRFPQ